MSRIMVLTSEPFPSVLGCQVVSKRRCIWGGPFRMGSASSRGLFAVEEIGWEGWISETRSDLLLVFKDANVASSGMTIM